MPQYRSAHQLRRANNNSDSDSSDDSESDADAEGDAPETCTAVKTDGEVCGRDLPCPYHSETEENS